MSGLAVGFVRLCFAYVVMKFVHAAAPVLLLLL